MGIVGHVEFQSCEWCVGPGRASSSIFSYSAKLLSQEAHYSTVKYVTMHPVTMTHGNDGRAARRLLLKETIHRAIMLCRFHLALKFLWDWREYPYKNSSCTAVYTHVSFLETRHRFECLPACYPRNQFPHINGVEKQN